MLQSAPTWKFVGVLRTLRLQVKLYPYSALSRRFHALQFLAYGTSERILAKSILKHIIHNKKLLFIIRYIVLKHKFVDFKFLAYFMYVSFNLLCHTYIFGSHSNKLFMEIICRLFLINISGKSVFLLNLKEVSRLSRLSFK